MPKLLLLSEGAVIRDYPLESGTLRIGRKADNDIILDDSSVSGWHAEVETRPSEFLDNVLEVRLRDLNSTNGTLGFVVENEPLRLPTRP